MSSRLRSTCGVERSSETDALLAAAHDCAEQAVVELRDGAAEATTVEDVLAGCLGALFARLAENPGAAHLCLVEVPTLGERGRAARDAAVDRCLEAVEDELALIGAEPRTEFAGRMAAGAVFEVAQRAAHEHTLAELPALVPQLAGHWAPAFGA